MKSYRVEARVLYQDGYVIEHDEIYETEQEARAKCRAYLQKHPEARINLYQVQEQLLTEYFSDNGSFRVLNAH